MKKATPRRIARINFNTIWDNLFTFIFVSIVGTLCFFGMLFILFFIY